MEVVAPTAVDALQHAEMCINSPVRSLCEGIVVLLFQHCSMLTTTATIGHFCGRYDCRLLFPLSVHTNKLIDIPRLSQENYKLSLKKWGIDKNVISISILRKTSCFTCTESVNASFTQGNL